jgi:hypothetical protein
MTGGTMRSYTVVLNATLHSQCSRLNIVQRLQLAFYAIRRGRRLHSARSRKELDGEHFTFAPFYGIWEKRIHTAYTAMPIGVDGSKGEMRKHNQRNVITTK